MSAVGVGVWLGHRAAVRPNLGVVVLFGAAMILAENAAVVLPSTLRVSPSILLVLAAITAFDGRGTTVGALLVGACGPLVVSHLRRRRFAVVAFNCAQYALSAVAAAAVYDRLRAGGAPAVAAVVVAAVTFALVNIALVLPSAVAESGTPAHALLADMLPAIPNYIGFGLLGALLGRLYANAGPAAAVAALAVAVIARSVFGALLRARQANMSMDAVHGFTAGLDHTGDGQATVLAVLGEARRLLRAEVAELVVLRAGDPDAIRTVLDRTGTLKQHRIKGAVRELDAVSAGPLLALSWERGLSDVMIAPLRGDGGVVGCLLVGNRLPELGPFEPGHLAMFETLANHAAVALENGQLIDRIRWDSLHDPLTGLPNRTCFSGLVDRAGASGQLGAVLLIDLDRFREVNDTLGHDHGDSLLVAVASRLTAEIGDRGQVARLGGDEFAVLLNQSVNGDAAREAVGLLAALDDAFEVDGFALEITASIGIALLPVHGRTAITILRRADIAMYAAKAEHSGWEVYRVDRDRSSRQRLALAGELRRAIARRELEVHYQPKADLRTGAITGVEALVRWPHPQHGLLMPDDFVSIAEHAGLIRPLTIFVLRDAARRCQTLRAQGFPVDVAVNLSVRSVLDVGLPDMVGSILREAGLGAGSLVLEITESSVMADPARSIGVLGRLSSLGVGISIDDFGTGYSSLTHLRRLPIDEVKIDRSFVAGLTTDISDAVIVRSTIELARNLGLRVVAEGVEDEATWQRLADLGCDAAQGFYLSRAVTGEALTDWLQSDRTIRPTA
jgi:diguanylate cyclase (GGDEF)-like protein